MIMDILFGIIAVLITYAVFSRKTSLRYILNSRKGNRR